MLLFMYEEDPNPETDTMTHTERESLEKDVVFEAEKAKRDLRESLDRLAMIGERLISLGNGLRNHPELVTPVPEMDGPDYREALRMLPPEKIIELCREVRTLRERERITAQRKAHFGF